MVCRLIAVSTFLSSKEIDIGRLDNPLSHRTPDRLPVPDMWQLGMGEERARVAVVGCGGAGCNVLRRVASPPNGVRIAMNDTAPPKLADVQTKIIVRADSLQAYASMDEKAVQQMETDEEKEISAALLDRDLILILGGLGGELGGWGMSLVGRVARILGDTTLGFATIPFGIEGPIRRQLAEAELHLLQKRIDGVVTFGNDQLLQVAKDLPMTKAFAALSAIWRGRRRTWPRPSRGRMSSPSDECSPACATGVMAWGSDERSIGASSRSMKPTRPRGSRPFRRRSVMRSS